MKNTIRFYVIKFEFISKTGFITSYLLTELLMAYLPIFFFTIGYCSFLPNRSKVFLHTNIVHVRRDVGFYFFRQNKQNVLFVFFSVVSAVHDDVVRTCMYMCVSTLFEWHLTRLCSSQSALYFAL